MPFRIPSQRLACLRLLESMGMSDQLRYGSIYEVLNEVLVLLQRQGADYGG